MRFRLHARLRSILACGATAVLALALGGCTVRQSEPTSIAPEVAADDVSTNDATILSGSMAGPGSNAELTELAARVDRLNRVATQLFGPVEFRDPAAPRILAEAEAEWGRRYHSCPDDDCRSRILSDRLARMEFAFGERPMRFRGMAFPGGSLGIRTVDAFVGEILGSLTIYPIIDDLLLIDFGSFNTPPRMATCDLRAEGRAEQNGEIRMTSLGGPDDPTGRWRVSLTSGGHLIIKDLAESGNWWCGASNSIPATYEIESVNGVEN